MSKPSKRAYQKFDFSDHEIEQQIRDQIREIQDRNLKKLEQEQKIYQLYKERKQQKKLQKYRQSKGEKFSLKMGGFKNRASSDQEGEIHTEKQQRVDLNPFNDFTFEGVPSISNLGDHIRPLTLTRNKIVDLLNTRRFQELVKGCFVRYLIDSNPNSNSNSYIIAQIVGVTQGNKQYNVNNVKTKVLLKLQQTSENVVTLSLQLISNQHPPGGLQIEKWLQTNRSKIPKQKELKQKLEEHNKLLVQQLSSVQIDSNIWKKAKRIAQQDKEEIKQDINPLVDFVGQKLHNLQARIEVEDNGRDLSHEEADKLKTEASYVRTIHQKLKRIREAQLKNRSFEKKAEVQKKQRRYDLNLVGQKRKDNVGQKCKAKYIMLATHEGCMKLRQSVLQNHMKYNLELDEEDMQY